MANNTREKKYEIQDRAGKGRALIAILPIERGDVIIEEKPIFTISYGKISPKEVDNALDKLEDQVAINKQWLEESSTNREAFFRLSYQGKEENRKYWRLKTNCFSFRGNQEKGSGHMVYDEISYANHSCAPNALVEVDQEWTLRGTLRCIRNIAAGEEIVIAYHANLVTAEQRAEIVRSTLSTMSQALKVENCDKGRGCRCIPPQGEEEAWATKAESYVNSLVRLEIADDRYAWALLRKAQLLWYVHKRNYVDTGDYTFFWLAEDTMQEAIEAYGCYAGEDTQQWSLDMMYVARDLRLFAYENKKAEEAKNEIMEEVEGGDPMDVDNE